MRRGNDSIWWIMFRATGRRQARGMLLRLCSGSRARRGRPGGRPRTRGSARLGVGDAEDAFHGLAARFRDPATRRIIQIVTSSLEQCSSNRPSLRRIAATESVMKMLADLKVGKPDGAFMTCATYSPAS